MLVVGRNPQVLPMGAFHRLLESPASCKHSKNEHDSFYDSSLEVICSHFCSVLLVTRVSPIHYRRQLYRGIDIRKQVIIEGHLTTDAI